MIVASLLLVIAAAVTLLVGLLNREVIEWVYASIACCLLAGLLLTIGVLRSRPSRKPVLQSGGDGQAASWAGASQWGGAAGNDTGSDVLTRDDEDETAVVVGGGDDLTGDDEPTRTGLPTAGPGADAASVWAPSDAEADDTGEVRVIEPEPEPQPEPAAAPAPVEDDVVVVPKPSSRNGGAADTGKAAGRPAAAAAVSGQSAESVGSGPAATPAKSTADDAARFEQVLSPISGVGAAKRAALFQHFGTYRKLRAASPEKLAEVPGVSRTLADRIYAALHGK